MARLHSRVVYRVHALQRMQEHDISDDQVRKVLSEGKEIETYPADRPYPSCLVLGWSGSRPIHVVAAENSADNETLIVTVYEPGRINGSRVSKGERADEMRGLQAW